MIIDEEINWYQLSDSAETNPAKGRGVFDFDRELPTFFNFPGLSDLVSGVTVSHRVSSARSLRKLYNPLVGSRPE